MLNCKFWSRAPCQCSWSGLRQGASNGLPRHLCLCGHRGGRVARIAVVAFALLWLAAGSALAGTVGALWQLQGSTFTPYGAGDFFDLFYKPTLWPNAIHRDCEVEDSSQATTCTYWRSQADKNANINNYWAYTRLPHCQGIAGATLSFSGTAWVCTTPATKCEGLANVPYPGYKLTYPSRPSSSSSRAACFDGCSLEAAGTGVCWGEDGGQWVCSVESAKFTGLLCNGQPSLSPGATPTVVDGVTTTGTLQDIPQGMCPGEVMGQTVYKPCGTVSTGTRSSSVTSVGSSTVETTVDSSTVCANGQCTTTFSKTTTVSAPSASTTASVAATTGTAVQSQDQFCKANPSDKNCQSTASSFAGSCQAGAFVCTGDAVSCATARAVNESKCLIAGTNDISSVVNALQAGNYGGTLTNVVKSFSSFEQSSSISQACPADQTVNLGALSFVIPLGANCSSLQLLGNVMVAFTLLWATVFVLRGFGGG